jgi:signal transduction histidine kinase
MNQALAYVANLELEVDRLRKQGQFVQQEAWGALQRIRLLCAEAAPAGQQLEVLEGIEHVAKELGGVLCDLQPPHGYHPAHDQVVAIALRPLVEQVFRWQQRLAKAPQVALRLELESECLEWFPARLRHILDNLISNALKYRDPAKAESWVQLELKRLPNGHELRVSDNGVGLTERDSVEVFKLFYRAAPVRAADLGVGLAVAQLLVEQSGGTLTVDSGQGQGTTFVAVLPSYAMTDFLT